MGKNKYLALFGLASISTMAYIAFLVYRISPVAFGSAVYYCRSVLASTMEYLPIAAIVTCVGFLAIRLVLWQRQMLRITHLTVPKLPKKLMNVIATHGITVPVRLFRFNEAYAFCYGLRKPSIYLSTRLLQLMSSKEVAAILLHEQQHIHQNDTRVITILRTISLFLFPFPYLWELTHAYSTVQEISADTAVYRKTGTFASLRSALRKILLHPARTPLPVFALPFTGYAVYQARIQAMQGVTISLDLSRQALVYSVGSLLVLSTILFMPVSKTTYNVNDQEFVVMCYNQSCELSCVDRPNEPKMTENKLMSGL